MSLTNPNTPVSQQDLQDFYHKILPYMGGSADAGFTPVGSIIAIMGVTAPANYLACNGQIVNVADYPELANYFQQQFGTKYKFGGSGTTFGIPNLKGQFLRGTGTNSDSTQGSGEAVGTRQKATEVPIYTTNNAETALIFPVHATGSESTKPKGVNKDSESSTGDTFGNLDFKSRTSGSSPCRITTRPTNTSVLFCIATKNIYMNPSLDYSTDEKVVGTWIDGKTLYQRTIVDTMPTVTTDGIRELKTITLPSDVDIVSDIRGIVARSNGTIFPIGEFYTRANDKLLFSMVGSTLVNNRRTLILGATTLYDSEEPVYVTIQYTKTTD